MLDEKTRRIILNFQKSEITEHNIYAILARETKGENSGILDRISKEELSHYHRWKRYSQTEVLPNRLAVLGYLVISKVLGLTFAVKMMEKGEEKAQDAYAEISERVPEAKEIFRDESEHERLLVNMLDEEKIAYMGSIVLGLNDALVELTGTLAGLTFALQNTVLVGTAGLITGIAASLSMSASEYLSRKSEKEGKNPAKASFYTGITYVLTVLALIVPYFLFPNLYLAFGFTLSNAFCALLFFTFFVSVVKEIPFRKTLGEMLFISFGVAAVSFAIGWIARLALSVEI